MKFNAYHINFFFPVEFERIYGTSNLIVQVVATSEESALNKAERTLPSKMREGIKKHKITIM